MDACICGLLSLQKASCSESCFHCGRRSVFLQATQRYSSCPVRPHMRCQRLSLISLLVFPLVLLPKPPLMPSQMCRGERGTPCHVSTQNNTTHPPLFYGQLVSI